MEDDPFVNFYTDEDGNFISKQAQGNKRNGELHGEYIQFFRNEKIEVKAHYRNGELHGEYIQFYESGQIEKTAHYRNGKLEGEVSLYYENKGFGALFKSSQKLWTRGNYSNGKKHGTFQSFLQNGEKDSHWIFENGVLVEDVLEPWNPFIGR